MRESAKSGSGGEQAQAAAAGPRDGGPQRTEPEQTGPEESEAEQPWPESGSYCEPASTDFPDVPNRDTGPHGTRDVDPPPNT